MTAIAMAAPRGEVAASSVFIALLRRDMRVVWTSLTCVLTGLLLVGWFALFSGLRWWVRWGLPPGLVAASGLFLWATVDEVHFTWTSPTSLTFDWRGAPNDLRYGLTSAYGATALGVTPSPAPFSSAGPFWQAAITGLTAGTAYHYSIGGSPDQVFRTMPATSAYRFDVEGDIGSSNNYPNVTTTQSAIARLE